MVDTVTYPELSALGSISGTDIVALYPTGGPLQRTTVDDLSAYVATGGLLMLVDGSNVDMDSGQKTTFRVYIGAASQTDMTAAQADIASLTASQNAGSVGYTLYSQLAANTTQAAGALGTVFGPDAGTHTDPVVGGTVDNIGRYSWSAAPAGWKRVAGLPSEGQTEWPDYPTGLSNSADGDIFSFPYGTGYLLNYTRTSSTEGVYTSTTPADEVPGNVAHTAAGMSSGIYTLPANPFMDAVTVDALFDHGPLANRANPTNWLSLLPSSRPSSLQYVGEPAQLAVDNVGGTTAGTFGVTGVDGASRAVRVVNSSGSGGGLRMAALLLPPGQWTMAFEAKSNTSNFTIQFGANSYTGLVNANLTTSFQTFYLTFTLTAFTSRALQWAIAAGPYDVTYDNLRVIPGAAPGSAQADGSIVWGPPVAALDNYVADNPSGASIPFWLYSPAITTPAMTSATATIAVRFTGALPTYCDMISTVDGTGFYFGKATGFNTFEVRTAIVGSALIGSDLMGPSADWTIISATLTPTGCKLYINGILVKSNTTAWSGRTSIAPWSFFELIPGQFAGGTMWSRALTDAEQVSAYAVWLNRLSAMGEVLETSSTGLVMEGDSITFGAIGFPPYSLITAQAFNPQLVGQNVAVSGATRALVVSRLPATIAYIQYLQSKGKSVIFTCMIGVNDRASITDATTAGTYWGLVKSTILNPILAACPATATAPAVRIVAITPTHTNDTPAYNSTGLPALVALMLADAALYSAVINVNVGGMASWSGTYWADNLHPNTAGHAIIGAAVVAGVTPLVA